MIFLIKICIFAPKKGSKLCQAGAKVKFLKFITMSRTPIIEYKGTQLFRDDEMIARKNVSQQEFEDLLGYENACKIVTACSKAAEESKEKILNTPPSHQNRNFKSNIWNSNVQGAMIEAFPNNSGFCKGRRFYVEIVGHRLFFKKVDKRLRYQSITTKAVRMYEEQLSDDTRDTSPITYIGYQISSTYTELIGVYAVHIVSGTIEWYTDLSEFIYVKRESTPLHSQPTQDDEISVVPKNKKRLNETKKKRAGA